METVTGATQQVNLPSGIAKGTYFVSIAGKKQYAKVKLVVK
jgi:hypothetical protein